MVPLRRLRQVSIRESQSRERRSDDPKLPRLSTMGYAQEEIYGATMILNVEQSIMIFGDNQFAFHHRNHRLFPTLEESTPKDALLSVKLQLLA